MTMSPTGEARRRVRHTTTDDYAPNWSPDGRRLVFVRWGKGIFVADVNGRRRPRRLTADSYSPVWSPDGRRIAFTRDVDEDETAYVHVMDANGRRIRRLHEGSDPDWQPVRR